MCCSRFKTSELRTARPQFGCMLVSSWLPSPFPCRKPLFSIRFSQARLVTLKKPSSTSVVSQLQTPGTMLLEEKKELVANSIRGVPDFPKKGILFWDITTLCLDPAAFRCCIEAFTERYKDKKIDVIAGQDLSSLIMCFSHRMQDDIEVLMPVRGPCFSCCRLRSARLHIWPPSGTGT